MSAQEGLRCRCISVWVYLTLDAKVSLCWDQGRVEAGDVGDIF